MENAEKDDVVLRIKATKDLGALKKLAGAICWRLNEAGYCKARACKMDAINSSIKAIAIVNQRVLTAGVLLSMDPCFAATEKTDEVTDDLGQPRANTALAMDIYDVAEVSKPSEFIEYRVSGKKDDAEDVITRLAGAIAPPVRNGKGVKLRCIGPIAVYRAILACTIAKGYIHMNGLSAIVVPNWASMPSSIPNQPPVSLIEVSFWGQKTERKP